VYYNYPYLFFSSFVWLCDCCSYFILIGTEHKTGIKGLLIALSYWTVSKTVFCVRDHKHKFKLRNASF
jgi:hypothetical protein